MKAIPSHSPLSSHRKALSLIPVYFSIAVYVFVYTQIYIWLTGSYTSSNIFDFSQAIGALFLGTLSDRFCRRKTLLWSYACGVLLIYFVYKFPSHWYLLFFLGMLYNPIPIVRAGMVDNMKNYSTIKLISFSFFIQFLPEAFYSFFYKMPGPLAFYLSFGALVAAFALSYFLFYDYRDALPSHPKFFEIRFSHIFHEAHQSRALYTLFAFIPPLIVYFVSDNILNTYSNDPVYYSLLSFGFMIGALTSCIFKKTPHVAVITVAYAICLVLSLIPPAAIVIYRFSDFSLPFHFIVFGCIMGFYISFVYDTLLKSIYASFRGTTSGLLDFLCSSSYILNVKFLSFLQADLFIAFVLFLGCFFLSLILQKQAE